MQLCEYGCGIKGRYQLKNGKWCCNKNQTSCPGVRKKLSEAHMGKTHSKETKKKMSESKKGIKTGPQSEETKKKRSEAMKGKNTKPKSEEQKKKQSKSMQGKNTGKIPWNKGNRLTIEKIIKSHPLFSKVEEMRYNPNKSSEKEIQVHCKNHNCKDSKEKGGWFAPTSGQLFDRIVAIENPKGFGESHFYCSQHCKDTCSLYGIKSDPLKENNLPYTPTEHAEFIKQTLIVKDKEICFYCGGKATIVHHTRPVKLEPFLALDAEYAISVCQDCHYKYGHKTGTECSTANLANVTCSPESQKFLNQK